MAYEPVWRGPSAGDITAWTIVQAGHTVGRRFWAALAEVGLTPVQFGVLMQLDASPGMSNAALARAVLVTPQSMSELLAGLDDQDLVRRELPSSRGRPVSASLTATGRRRLRRCEQVIADVEASLGLSPADARRVNDLLRTVLTESG